MVKLAPNEWPLRVFFEDFKQADFSAKSMDLCGGLWAVGGMALAAQVDIVPHAQRTSRRRARTGRCAGTRTSLAGPKPEKASKHEM